MLRFDKSAGRHDTTTAVATGVSYQRQWLALITSQITQARNSLFVALVAAFLSGCIIADPPRSDPPARTPPFLALNKAIPPTHKVKVLEGADPQLRIKVPFRSEDNGEPVIAMFHLDFSVGEQSSSYERIPDFSPSTLSVERDIDWQLNDRFFRSFLGCHKLTMFVTHLENVDPVSVRPDPVKALDDTAQATWWIYIKPELGDGEPSIDLEAELDRCPRVTELDR